MRTHLNRRPSRWNTPYAPRLEALEDRTAPSVTPTFAGGTLTFNGTQESDQIQIVAIDEDSFLATFNAPAGYSGGTQNTNGTTTQTFNGVTSIVANLNGGDDSLTIDLDTATTGTANLPITINGGDGDDDIRVITNNSVGAPVSSTNDTLTLTVDLGAGNDQFRFFSDGTAAGGTVNLTVNGGADDDIVGLRLGTLLGTSTVNVNLGEGNNFLGVSAIGGASAGGSLTTTVTGGSLSDSVRFQLGDLGTTGTSTSTGAASTVTLNVNLGAGNDQFRLQGGTVGANGTLNLNLNAGSGNDVVGLRLDGLQNGGDANLRVNLGDGNDYLGALLGSEGIGAGSNLRVQLLGGTGNDNVRFQFGDIGNATTGGSASVIFLVDLGAGNDVLRSTFGAVGQGSFLGYFVNAGQGNDAIPLNLTGNISADALLALAINLGSGNDRFGLNASGAVSAAASISLALLGGNGIDRAVFNLANGFDQVFSSFIDDVEGVVGQPQNGNNGGNDDDDDDSDDDDDDDDNSTDD